MGFQPRLGIAFASMLCLLLVISAGIRRDGGHPVQIQESPQVEEQYVKVPYVVQLAPWERTEVVRMQVSLSALSALGFQVHTPETGGSVTADVLCGQDRRVVAIAILPDSRIDSELEVQE
jgi:hypothetical protein